LYDSPHEAQFWMIFNENKKLVHMGDFQPESTSLNKGKYTVRVSFRHDNLNYLKLAKETSLILEIHIPKDKQIALDLFPSRQDALVSGSKFPGVNVTMRKGATRVLVINAPDESKLPKFVQSGDTLLGYIRLLKVEDDSNFAVPSKGLVELYGGFLIKLAVQKKNGGSSSSSKSGKMVYDSDKSPSDNLKLWSIQFLTQLLDQDKYNEFRELVDSDKVLQDNLTILVSHLKYLHKKENDTDLEIELANRIISLINQEELALFYGTQHDSSSETKKMDEKKSNLLDALNIKGQLVLKRLSVSKGEEKKSIKRRIR